MPLHEPRTEISDRDGFYDLLAWIKASERRIDILITLADNPMNSTEFANQLDVTPEAVRYHLNLLQQGGPDGKYPALVRVITPSRERYRLYGLTEAGTEVLDSL